MKTITFVYLVLVTSVMANGFVNPRTQQRSSRQAEGFLPIARLAEPVALGFSRASSWFTSTNGVEAFEVVRDVAPTAELQQLSASLDALVFLEFGEHIDGTDEQLARISAVVVSSLESHRIEYSKAETLTELQTAGAHINNLRSIISLQAKIVSLQL